MRMRGTTCSISSRNGASFRSSVPNCSRWTRTAGRAAVRLDGRQARGEAGRGYRAAAVAVHAERRGVLVSVGARPPRGHVHAHAQRAARGEFSAAEGVAAAGGDHRLRSLRLHDLRFDAGKRDQRRALRRRAVHRGVELYAQPRGRPAERARAIAAPRRLSPAGPLLGLAHLRRVRRGHARIRVRAAERAPHARKALLRTRAQPPADHRQQLLELAGAPVPAHGQAAPAVGPARRRRGAGRRPYRRRRAPDGLPAAGERAHPRLQRRGAIRR